eukprot:gene20838-40748_t
MKNLLLALSFTVTLIAFSQENDSIPHIKIEKIKPETSKADFIKPIVQKPTLNQPNLSNINCTFDEIYQVSDVEGWIKVKNEGKYGFIDKDCNEIVPCIYDEIIGFHAFLPNSLMVKSEKKYGFINFD